MTSLKKIKKLNEETNLGKHVMSLLDTHIEYCNKIDEVNNEIKNISKKIRQPNFPEFISEYIAGECYCCKTKQKVSQGKTGDLECNGNKIEVKAFSSNGPTSFGPNESWNELLFVDATQFRTKNFKIYRISIPNNSEKFQSIKINKKETFKDQCSDNRRPRLSFKEIQNVLKDDIELLFSGEIFLEDNKLQFLLGK